MQAASHRGKWLLMLKFQLQKAKPLQRWQMRALCSGRSAIKLLAFYPKRLVFINPYLISLKGLTTYTPKVRHKLQRIAGTKLSIKCD